ncbi:MAG: CapA family protein [Clostridia bacterium]|nr:CapA family protein [Clostridia bacterium]
MRKLIVLLLCLLLIPAALAEEELSMADLMENADPDVVFDTFIVIPEEVEDQAIEVEATLTSFYEEDGSILITITATGDFTVGGDSRDRGSIWEDELERQGGDPNFALRNIRSILEKDDLTIVNFEGTLTESTYVPPEKRENQFLFSAPPSYTRMLTDNSIEAVSLENNHVLDHGQAVWDETKQHLTDAGVVWSGDGELGVYEVKGVKIAMLSYLCIDRYSKLWDVVPADIAAAKAQYPIVIVSFHWGNEKEYVPTNNQVKMGRLAVDSGADLVIGHHSHRIQPIEQYKGVYICYSLGNFCFAGHNNPDDMTSFLFQTRFRITEGEEGQVIANEGFRIIPIRISSRTNRNDFTPTPYDSASSKEAVVNTLLRNGKNLTYAVAEYPLEWGEEK